MTDVVEFFCDGDFANSFHFINLLVMNKILDREYQRISSS